MIENIITLALNGLVWGLIIALCAIGLSLVLGLMDVINMAHGSLYMAGGVIGWYLIRYLENFWLTVIAVFVIVGVIGIVIERAFLRKVEDNSINTIIVTFAIALIIEQIALMTFGHSPSSISKPVEGGFVIFGLRYPYFRLAVAALSTTMLFFLFIFLAKTKYGLWIRAAKQNRMITQAMGIPIRRVYMLTFGLGAAFSGLGGLLSSPICGVSYLMGVDILVLAFIVVIVGGLGSLKGTVLASIVLGEIEGLSSIFITPTQSKVLYLLIMITILVLRPSGLLGERGIRK
jgi:branched-chain amino acid transport system permease protein